VRGGGVVVEGRREGGKKVKGSLICMILLSTYCLDLAWTLYQRGRRKSWKNVQQVSPVGDRGKEGRRKLKQCDFHYPANFRSMRADRWCENQSDRKDQGLTRKSPKTVPEGG